MHTVPMTAPVMCRLMGKHFNEEEFEKGQRDSWNQAVEQPQGLAEQLEAVRRALSGGSYKNWPGPSYWLGCLNALDFIDA